MAKVEELKPQRAPAGDLTYDRSAPAAPMAGGRKREWIRKKVAAAAGSGSLRVRALWHRRRGRMPRVHLLRVLYESVVFRLLWVLESLLVLSTLCFFFLRFGFRL